MDLDYADEAVAGVGHGAAGSPPTTRGRWHGCYAFKHRYAGQHARVETRHGPAKGLVSMLAADRRGPAGSDLIPNGSREVIVILRQTIQRSSLGFSCAQPV